jgi:hypothetical protein
MVVTAEGQRVVVTEACVSYRRAGSRCVVLVANRDTEAIAVGARIEVVLSGADGFECARGTFYIGQILPGSLAAAGWDVQSEVRPIRADITVQKGHGSRTCRADTFRSTSRSPVSSNSLLRGATGSTSPDMW